ncbi:hypothetical protein Ahy_A05g021827 isoform A [Arachis hypogaea]|uniref:Uncharacterized protein n=1 Tax=Arachis hypogaea TaxID=3818 RepID=A0A445CYK4_ARAHY|nr:hypothetical protein Ahy_A05g021827 isoform A [Arachis hypogaea]
MGIKRRGIKSAATDALSQIIDFGSSTWRTLVKFVGDDKDKAIIISTTENSTRPSKNLVMEFCFPLWKNGGSPSQKLTSL